MQDDKDEVKYSAAAAVVRLSKKNAGQNKWSHDSGPIDAP
jgi:hypothetical protein